MTNYVIDFYIFHSDDSWHNGQIEVSYELPLVPRVGDEVVISDIDENNYICTVKKVTIYTKKFGIEVEAIIND